MSFIECSECQGNGYLECMECAKADILSFGVDDFRSLDPGTPLTRIYDKLTFVTGR